VKCGDWVVWVRVGSTEVLGRTGLCQETMMMTMMIMIMIIMIIIIIIIIIM